jgi:integrase
MFWNFFRAHPCVRPYKVSSERAFMTSSIVAQNHPDQHLTSAIDLVMQGLAPSSRRVYQRTYTLWAEFCQQHGLHPLSLTFENVAKFLNFYAATKTTKQHKLSALRRLVETLTIVDYENPQWAAMHRALLRIKVTSADSTGREREKKALTPRQVYAAFDVWAGDKLVAVRNRALLAVAFYGGLRRSEIAQLIWQDIDFENGTVRVRHGKGDKERLVPFASDDALPYLLEWQQTMNNIQAGWRTIFCGIRNRGTGELSADKPMSTTGIYNVIRKSGDFAPHDARRTLLTDMLNNGVSVADAQFVAGHANPQTTLHYAQVKDAKAVKGRIKVSY